MSFTVSCYTLFDITQTGTVNRNKPAIDEDENIWLHKRNTQCNFDTILQAISLRSQPEILNYPKQIKIKFDEFDNFGFLFVWDNLVSLVDFVMIQLVTLYQNCIVYYVYVTKHFHPHPN